MPGPRQPYRRVLLKLSGESLGGEGEFGIDPGELRQIAGEVIAAAQRGCQIAVVCGGGNIIRGATLAKSGLAGRAAADHMGMLGTLINAIAMREALAAAGGKASVFSAFDAPGLAQRFDRHTALRALDAGEFVVLGGGVGSPFFTTDTTAVLRAAELDCQAVLKGTKVDGVYDSDPKKNPKAKRFDTLTLTEALARNLGVMDATALAMAKDQSLPIVVYDYRTKGNTALVVAGEPIGTLVSPA